VPETDLERAALREYFRGNYSETLRLLSGPGVGPRGLAYMAFANAALGLLEGSSGALRVALARVQFTQARTTISSLWGAGADARWLATASRYVSPRVIEALDPATAR
jgi:hypothetical protein